MIENLGAWGTFIVAVTGVLTALGVGELIKRAVARRGERADAERQTSKEVAQVSAQGNLDVLRVLLEETRDRVNGYESQIVQMRADHARDMGELKAENRSLERRVSDLQATLRDYQLGNRVPRGMVLLPLREVRKIRETVPGLLNHDWYPGEAEAGDPGSVDVRLTPLPPGPEPA